MKFLTEKIYSFFLAVAFKQCCAASIPRSGKEGESINCFTVAIDNENQPYLIALEIKDSLLRCILWDGKKYSAESTLELSTINLSDLRIMHYYGLSTIEYFGVLDFIIGRLLFWPYIKVWFMQTISNFDQYFFNKKKLITKQRKDLLSFLINKATNEENFFHEIALMTKLYTIKWINHPDKDSQRRKLRFHLKSLCDTGELKYDDDNYIVTGIALRYIEEYEEQERRHTDNVKVQRRTFWLTLVIAALTLVQAGLIKLPLIFDLTK